MVSEQSSKFVLKTDKIQLRPHQEKAVERMHNGCVLTGDVGTGKTITSLAYAMLKETGRDIYVITTAKKRDSGDWQREAAMLGVGADSIIVDSWNNIRHYQKAHGAFFIFDEQRLVGTGAWVKTFLDIARKNHWVLLSATPGDTWMDYVPVFIANGFYKNVTEFRTQHVVYSRFSKYPKVERYLNPGLLQRRRALVLVDMPVVRHTTRHIKTVEVDYDKEQFDKVWKRRWNIYTDEPILDAGELYRVGRKVAYSDPSRLEAIRQLMRVHPKLIVFYNFDYELEMLRTLGKQKKIDSSTTRRFTSEKSFSASEFSSRIDITASLESGTGPILSPILQEKGASASGAAQDLPTFAIAEWNGHKHQPIPETDSWVYLVQYQAGAEGWNCIETDAMAFYSMTYSYKQFYQSQGRIDRMNTYFRDLYYYVLDSGSIVDKVVWRSLKAKRDFNVPRSKF